MHQVNQCVLIYAAALLALACGGADAAEPDRSCPIVDSVLHLGSGASCLLDSRQRATYRLQVNELSCDDRNLTVDGVRFSGGGGISINDFRIVCEAASTGDAGSVDTWAGCAALDTILSEAPSN